MIPYEIETLQLERPWANWLIIACCYAVYFFRAAEMIPDDLIGAFVLDGYSFPGILSYPFLHSSPIHLAGNMIFLWVFGNAICTNIGNWRYLATFVICTLVSAAIHNQLDGDRAIGASGAINGIVGIVLAMFPLNRVYVWFGWGLHGSSHAYVVIVGWLIFDIWGVVSDTPGIAFWAHIGGLLGGLVFGMLALKLGWFQLSEYDNRSLLEILCREYPE